MGDCSTTFAACSKTFACCVGRVLTQNRTRSVRFTVASSYPPPWRITLRIRVVITVTDAVSKLTSVGNWHKTGGVDSYATLRHFRPCHHYPHEVDPPCTDLRKYGERDISENMIGTLPVHRQRRDRVAGDPVGRRLFPACRPHATPRTRRSSSLPNRASSSSALCTRWPKSPDPRNMFHTNVYRYFVDRESLIVESIVRRARMNMEPWRMRVRKFHLLVSPSEMTHWNGCVTS